MSPSSKDDIAEIIERLRPMMPRNDPKAILLLGTLEDQMRRSFEAEEDLRRQISEFEEAYAKLTSPANRTGLFLKWLDEETGYVVIGDSEYVVNIDPKVDRDSISSGSKVRLNEAYAIVGVAPTSDSGSVVKVEAVLDEGRLRISSGGPGAEGRIIGRAHSLEESSIEAGDSVRLDSTGRLAVELFKEQENKDFFFEEVPDTPWSAIGGQDDAIRLIRETIEQPLLHPEVYEKYDKKPLKGILLFGPPGCGKTLIGKATASNLTKEYAKTVGHEVREYFMYISGPKILNMWLGETERMVREIFRIAREKAKEGRLVFIFLDEAESVLRTRSSGRWLNISNTVVPQFCAELDGLVALDNVVLMLTSNRPDYIDPAILRPERIDRKVKIGRPDKDASREILGLYLHDTIPIDPILLGKHKCDAGAARNELLDRTIEALWTANSSTEFLKILYRNGTSSVLYWRDLVSGALLKSVVGRAKDTAIRRAIADLDGDHGVSADDLANAIADEFRENEIFPKSDTQDDWLKLLDIEPESVVAVRPIAGQRPETRIGKTIS
jgi:proteasome-associated ATPase